MMKIYKISERKDTSYLRDIDWDNLKNSQIAKIYNLPLSSVKWARQKYTKDAKYAFDWENKTDEELSLQTGIDTNTLRMWRHKYFPKSVDEWEKTKVYDSAKNNQWDKTLNGVFDYSQRSLKKKEISHDINELIDPIEATFKSWYKIAKKHQTFKEKDATLTSEDREQIKSLFGDNLECSFAKDEDGYYCYTHRARSDSYKSIDKIPKSKVEFIGSTG